MAGECEHSLRVRSPSGTQACAVCVRGLTLAVRHNTHETREFLSSAGALLCQTFCPIGMCLPDVLVQETPNCNLCRDLHRTRLAI